MEDSPVQKEAELKLRRITRSDESHHYQTQGLVPRKKHSQLLAHTAVLSMNWNHWGKKPKSHCRLLDEDISVCSQSQKSKQGMRPWEEWVRKYGKHDNAVMRVLRVTQGVCAGEVPPHSAAQVVLGR